MGDQVDLLRGGAALGQHLAGPEVALDAPVRERGQHLHVVEALEQGQFAEFGGDHPDARTVLDELEDFYLDAVILGPGVFGRPAGVCGKRGGPVRGGRQ